MQRTICEVHRQIADVLVLRCHDRPELIAEILPLLNEAADMGMRLVLALIERKIALPDWSVNNVVKALKLRKERNRLVEALDASGRRL